jgi:high-affinity iron transporter
VIELLLKEMEVARVVKWAALSVASLLVFGVLIWQAVAASGSPDPLLDRPDSSAAILDIGVLVFREGLECILVLAAITAGLRHSNQSSGTSAIATGAGVGFAATLLTWLFAVAILDDLSRHISALQLQAATGLLAIVVLLIVMNWFFHKLYWTGWISFHNKKKHTLMQQANGGSLSTSKLFWGLALLGFSSFYREGVEVVLFLQSYRLRMGGQTVLRGVCIGLLLTAFSGILTFIAHRKLPYRRMLIITGILLGVVLLVMVGEQVQEMQLAHWLPTTDLPTLARFLPDWTQLWFSVFPNAQCLVAQGMAATIVLGSYYVAHKSKSAETPPVVHERQMANQS